MSQQFSFEDGESVIVWSIFDRPEATGSIYSGLLMIYEPERVTKGSIPIVMLYNSVRKQTFVYPTGDIVPFDRERYDLWAATYPHGKNERVVNKIREKLFGGDAS